MQVFENKNVDLDDFKSGMGLLAAAVNIITVNDNGIWDGMTATAACSVSAEPPQLLICVNQSAYPHDLIDRAEAFCLNVLARDQEKIAKSFAGMDDLERRQRFGAACWSSLVTKTPALDGALVNFDCEVAEKISTGTHTIFIGRIVAVRTNDQACPLIYGNGDFTGLMS